MIGKPPHNERRKERGGCSGRAPRLANDAVAEKGEHHRRADKERQAAVERIERGA